MTKGEIIVSDSSNSLALEDVEINETPKDKINLKIRNPYDSGMNFFVKSDYFSEEDDPFIKYMNADKDVVVIEGSISVSF